MNDPEQLPVAPTRKQVISSPDIDTDAPVTRRHKIDYLDHCSYPYDWDRMGTWGGGGKSPAAAPAPDRRVPSQADG